uniref:Peptidase_M13 domain-containing protein n=1 Tax=Parastrongyloides trichosuri TaxID=131310 RepID=A0A0N4ZW47_PARTI
MDDYDLEYTYYMCTFELKEVTSFAFQTTILNCLFGYIDITKSHNTIYEMFHLIKEAFRKLLYEKEWIDVKSRIKTFEKLRLMKFFFNYDGDLYSTITMDKVYGNLFLAPDDNFNVARTKMNMFMISANSANPKLFNVDVDPLELNAAYEVNENMFKAYIGLLRKPTYDNEFLTSMKYGGYGSIIGHEIIHGFSEEGLSYNGKKENVNIFSDYSLEEYNKRKKCILSQYSNHVESISKINVNGKLTLSENIADNGGIKIAYNAYKKYSEKYGSEKNESPRFNKYSNEQLFFISFAQSMCRKMNSAGGKDTIENDDHSPSEARVLLTLGNYKEFSNAFNCPVGSRMNPSSRCEVWKFNN